MKRASADLRRIKFKPSPLILTQTAPKLDCHKFNLRQKRTCPQIKKLNWVNERAKTDFGDKIYAEAALRAKQTRVNLC